MAIWQFTCNIIPVKTNSKGTSQSELVSWQEESMPVYEIDFLERKNSWSPQIVQYGEVDGTCIEFFYENDKLIEIICRLDLRTITRKVFIQVLEYVKSIDAVFFIDNKSYLPEEDIVLTLIKNSTAYQFCRNPKEVVISGDSSKLI